MIDAQAARPHDALRIWTRGWRRELLVAVLLLVLSGFVVAASAYDYRRISVFDEATHADQAYRLAHGELVRRGDTLSQEILEEWACRGFFNESSSFPACGERPYDPRGFPAGGINYNEFHPPLYYLVTGVLARVAVAVTPLESFVGAARLVGILWLAAGMYVLYRLLLELRVSRRSAVLVALLPALLPTVVHASATVNNDATALLAGSLMGLVGLRVLRGALHPGWVGATALLVASMKVVNGLAVIVLLALFAAVWWLERQDHELRKRLVLASAFAVLGVAAAQLGWGAVQDLRAPPGEYVNPSHGISGEPSDTFPIMQLLRNGTRFLPPTSQPFIPPDASGSSMDLWVLVSTLVLGSMPLAVALLGPARSVTRRIGVAVVVGAVVGSLVVGLQYWMDTNTYFVRMTPRYGLSVLPWIFVTLGTATDRDRGTRWALGGFVALGAALVVPSLVLAI